MKRRGKEGKKEEASSGLPVFAPLFFAQAMIGDCNGDARLGSCRKSDPRARDDDPSDDLVGKFVFYKKVVCKKVVLDRPKNYEKLRKIKNVFSAKLQK